MLFWPEGDRLWVLNETATYIWTLLPAGVEMKSAVADFAAAFSIPAAIARSGIEESLAGFLAEGLLEGCTPQRVTSQEQEWEIIAEGEPLQEPDFWIFSEQFVLAGEKVSVCSEDRSLGEQFVDLLHPLVEVSTNTDTPKIALALTSDGSAEGGWNVYSSGSLCYRGLEDQAVLPALMTLLFICICKMLDQFMLFHAAVLVRDGKALLLPAAAGSGKTTLAAEMATRGWICFSDELALINPLTGEIFPLLLPMSVKPGSIQILQKSYPGLAELPVWNRIDGQKVRYLLPPDKSFPEKDQFATVHRIVLPFYQEQGETALEPLEKPAALQSLAQTGSSNRPLREQDVRAMVALVENADCYQLHYSENRVAIEKLENIFYKV